MTLVLGDMTSGKMTFGQIDWLPYLQVKQVLKSGGAAREFYVSDLVTHVIAKDTGFPQFSEAKECNLTIVKVINSKVHT